MPDSAQIFRDIRDKKLSAEIVYEDDEVMAFHDKFPKAPTHILFIPKQEVASILSIDDTSNHLPGMLILKAKQFAQDNNIPGYKLTFHVGREGGQEIDYLHLHLMAN